MSEGFTSAEEKAFSALLQQCKPKEPQTVWFVLRDDKVRLAGESGQVALRVLPKYDCAVSGDRDALLVHVRPSHLGRLLAGVLFSENRKVEIYKFSLGAYALSESATPGNYEAVEHYLDDSDVSDTPKPVVAVLTESVANQIRVGLFIVRKVTKTVSLCSFEDNFEFDTFDTVLESLAPSECSLPESFKDEAKVIRILEKQGISVVKSAFKNNSLESVMKELEKVVDLSTIDRGQLERDERLSLLAGLLLLPTLSNLRFEIVQYDFSHFMKVSSSTLEGLHVFGKSSLFSTLNHTRTGCGERLLKSWLRQPLTSHELIQARLDIVEKLVTSRNCRKALHDVSLRKMPDFEKICQKCDGKRVTLADLFKAYTGISEVSNIVKALTDEFETVEDVISRLFVAPLQDRQKELKMFVALMRKTLDFEAVENGEYRVTAQFNETLSTLQEEIDEVKQKLNSQCKREAERLSISQKTLKLECNSQHGYFFRVTLKDEKSLRQKKELIFLDSTKQGVKFRTTQLERLNETYQDLNQRYQHEQQGIIDDVIETCLGYCKYFLKLSAKISELDCLVALATAAELAPAPYVKPTLSKDRVIELKKARHPILEQKGSINYIPNGAKLSGDGDNFIIITGPNLGGKSTYMRSVALCVYLTQIGSFVPCQEAIVCPVDNILVRIGANDSQFYGVSTFMAEMLDASRILRHATSNSLIVIDEIGRGTSTYDGFGLAWAISHYIASKIKAFTLFATHFHEMTSLAEELPGVTNVFCDAIVEDNQLTLLYSIGPGVSKKSFGIEVAQMAGFPDSILQNARRLLRDAERNTENLDDDEQILKMKTLLGEYKEDCSTKRKADIASEAAAVMKKVKKSI